MMPARDADGRPEGFTGSTWSKTRWVGAGEGNRAGHWNFPIRKRPDDLEQGMIGIA